ncbi:uncharacterized protein G2W53_014501 [Senna tora]|uniref:Uncharacterized protein n=1 Tax=Senna tora TaxID=362788 RepID=A0A834WTQ7_9FABA|nr:uncharacterized protein G2W53_014501 [Senna tora]
MEGESNQSLRVAFVNSSGINGQMGLMIKWKVCEVLSKHILNQKSRTNLNRIPEVQVKRFDAQVSQTDRFAMLLGIQVDLMLEWTHDRLEGELNRSLRVALGNPIEFIAGIGFVISFKLNLKRNQEVQVKCVVAQVSQIDRASRCIRES